MVTGVGPGSATITITATDGDGYAATRAIRSSGRPDAGTIPIIAMSANAYAEDVQKCLDTGMNAHISKPLYKDVMLETIERFV